MEKLPLFKSYHLYCHWLSWGVSFWSPSDTMRNPILHGFIPLNWIWNDAAIHGFTEITRHFHWSGSWFAIISCFVKLSALPSPSEGAQNTNFSSFASSNGCSKNSTLVDGRGQISILLFHCSNPTRFHQTYTWEIHVLRVTVRLATLQNS